jgi:hypothetical protein
MSTPQEFMTQGIAAYRNRDFARAIEFLQTAVDMQPDLWEAKLYVAMCHYKTGMVYLAANSFRHIRDNCPDAEIRGKAEAALGPVNREACEITLTNIKKPTMPIPKDDDDGGGLEWVAPDHSLRKQQR